MEANATSEKTERMNTIKDELISEVQSRREAGFRHDDVRRGSPDPAETPDRKSPLRFRFTWSGEASQSLTNQAEFSLKSTIKTQ